MCYHSSVNIWDLQRLSYTWSAFGTNGGHKWWILFDWALLLVNGKSLKQLKIDMKGLKYHLSQSVTVASHEHHLSMCHSLEVVPHAGQCAEQ